MSRRRKRPQPSPPPLLVETPVLLLALVVVPVYFNIQSSVSFEPDKAALLRSLAVVAAVALLTPPLSPLSRVREKWTGLHVGLKWMLALLGSMLLATIFGIDPVSAFWGNHERGFGLLSMAAMLVMAGAAYRMVSNGHFWLLIDAIILASLLPAFYGLLQVLGYDPVTGRAVSFALGQRASSTPGNPLFLADFLLLVLPLTLARLAVIRPQDIRQRWGLILILVLQTLALLATGSLTALGAGMAAVAFLLVAAGKRQERRSWWAAGVAILAAGLLLLLLAWFVPDLLPARLGQVFASGGSGGQRLLFWQSVVDLLRDQPRWLLTGLGPDTLALALPPYLPPSIAHFEIDWAFRIPDRAHTWVLDSLVNGGVLALLSTLLLWTSVLSSLVTDDGRVSYRSMWPPLLGGGLGALLGAVVLGLGAVPVGLTAGWLAGALFLLWRQKGDQADGMMQLAPFVLAALIAHWVFFTFSFRTHAADLLAWALMGAAMALPRAQARAAPSSSADVDKTRLFLAGAAWAAFGFSLSAAWPRALTLWIGGGVLMLAGSWFLSSKHFRSHSAWLFLPAFALLPAMWLNRVPGIRPWLAYAWLLIWLLIMVGLLMPRPGRRQYILWLALPLVLVVNLPMFGDIAYKSALLSPYDVAARDTLMQRALLLSPHDHILAAGIVTTEMITFPAEARLDSEVSQRIQRLYTAAMQAQPRAVEPVAAYAEWLRQRALVDPQAREPAQRMFARVLQLSPHDIESRNRLALLYWQNGDTAMAVQELQDLLDVDPLYGPTYLNLAQIQQAQGKLTAARATLTDGVSKVPWWPVLRQALEALPR